VEQTDRETMASRTKGTVLQRKRATQEKSSVASKNFSCKKKWGLEKKGESRRNE